MTHPTPAQLLDAHYGELSGASEEHLRAHAGRCPECAAFLADLALLDEAFGPSGERPPADDLERVLARVAALPPARARRAAWLSPVLPSVVAIASGALAIHLRGLPAAVVFFAAGALVTLSLAPTLILESRPEDLRSTLWRRRHA